MRLGTIIGSTCLLLILMGGPAQATLLNLQSPAFPAISSSLISITYDAGSDQFVASGLAVQFATPLETINFTPFNFNLTATIDDSGNASAGLLDITGTIANLGYTSGTLLTGNLTAFGFMDPPGGDIFEFLFSVTGGDLASLYGSEALVIMDGNLAGAFNGTFISNFQSPGNSGNSTTLSQNYGTEPPVPTPEPGTLLLMLTGLGGLYVLRKRAQGKIS